MRLMTDKNIKLSISNVRATLGVEGVKLNRRSIVYGTKYLRGQITSEQAIEEITRYMMRKNGK